MVATVAVAAALHCPGDAFDDLAIVLSAIPMEQALYISVA